jgi:hypothetical protein
MAAEEVLLGALYTGSYFKSQGFKDSEKYSLHVGTSLPT